MENQNQNQNNSMDEIKTDASVFPDTSSVTASDELGQSVAAAPKMQISTDDLHIELARQAAVSVVKDELEEEKKEEDAIEEMEKNIEENIIPQINEEIKENVVSNSVQEENLGAGKIAVITKILEQIAGEIEQIKKLIATSEGAEIRGELMVVPEAVSQEITSAPAQSNVVEGVFDGEAMIGSDGKKYDVPPNYASKSKLVEGDILKLTITVEGSFLFKQIGPIERNRIVGMLTYEPVAGRYVVAADGKKWFVLTASVTYFRGKPGDEAVILVPKSAPSQWAAVENIIGRKNFGN